MQLTSGMKIDHMADVPHLGRIRARTRRKTMKNRKKNAEYLGTLLG